MGIFSKLFQRSALAANTPAYVSAEMFVAMRQAVFDLRTQDLGLQDGAVIAVLMETGYPKAVVSLVSVADGSTSLYFSNGGGTIGAGEHQPVRAATLRFISHAASVASGLDQATTFPLPERGRVRFYLITKTAVFTADAIEDDLGNNRHALSPLFHEGHEVIAAIRENT